MNAIVKLKKGREKSVLRKHPWIFSGAVEEEPAGLEPGATVDVLSADGRWLACGAWSKKSQIRVRIWTFEKDENPGYPFFERRIAMAQRAREDLFAGQEVDAYRLVNAESDGLPGLNVDRYAGYLVCQFLTVGVEKWKNEITDALKNRFSGYHIYERSDSDVRKLEGLGRCEGILLGREPQGTVEIDEHGIRMLVDIQEGHKTGHYLDQRENRMKISARCKDKEVLNVFSYTGGFGLWALHGGAKQVINLDSSGPFLQISKENVRLNGFDENSIEHIQDDAFQGLRRFVSEGRTFDVIILDPPKFADSARNLQRAARGYKDINLQAFRLLRPGGMLFTFSCSGLMTQELFQKIVADAALDAGREAKITERFTQSADHTIDLNFPEGFYLKGLGIYLSA